MTKATGLLLGLLLAGWVPREAAAERIAPERAARLAAAERLLAAGDWDEAGAILDELAAAMEVEEAVWACRLDLELRRTDPGAGLTPALEQAAAVLERRSTLGPRSCLLLAETARREGDREAEASWYRRVLARRPEDDATRLRLALLEMSRGDDAAAAEAALELIPRNPRCPAILQIAGRSLVAVGDATRATPILERLVALVPGNAEAHALLGTARLLAGRVPEAAAEFATAAEREPTPERRVNLGLALSLAGRAAEAIDVLRAVTADHPDHLGAWNNLGIALAAAGRLAEAHEALARALALDPDNERIRVNLDDLEALIRENGTTR